MADGRWSRFARYAFVQGYASQSMLEPSDKGVGDGRPDRLVQEDIRVVPLAATCGVASL